MYALTNYSERQVGGEARPKLELTSPVARVEMGRRQQGRTTERQLLMDMADGLLTILFFL